jgi:heat shock protein HslJ
VGRIGASEEKLGRVRAFVLVVVLLLTACGTQATPTRPDTAGSADSGALEGTEWVLTSLKGQSLIEGTEITLFFEEAFLGGSMTCNG